MSGKAERSSVALPNPVSSRDDPRQIAYALFSHAVFSNLVY